MAGLDSIKHFDDGGGVEASQGAIQTTAPKATGITGKIALDPTQTESILANMQQYINERNSPMNALMGGINKAKAGLAGPSALTAYQQQENLQDKQIMDYRTQMAAYRAAQAQAKNEAERYAAVTPGAGSAGSAGGAGGAGGAGPITKGFTDPQSGVFISPEQLQREFLAGPAGQGAARQEYLKTAATEQTKKQFSPAMSAIVDVFGMGQMTLAQAEKYLQKQPNLQAVVDGKKVPLASVVTEELTKNPSAENKPAEMGQAVKIASELGIPIISGDRDWDKQYALYLESLKPNYKGNPVAFPGMSKHQTGNAIDTLRNLPEADRKKLTDAGFKQTVPNDPGHWELVGAPAATAPAATAPAATAPAATAPAATAPAATAPAATAPAATAPAAIKPSQVVSGPPEPPNKSKYVGIPGGQSKYEADKLKWDEDIKVFNDTRKELAKSGIASIKEEADKFITRTDYDVLGERAGTNDYLKTLVKKWGGNPNVAGVLNDPTWGNAIATALQKGVSTPGGNIAMPDIVEILQKTRPGATTDEIEASKELARVLGQRILDVVQKSKGSSSDKDWVAFKQIAGSADNGWDALQRIQKYDEAQIRKDKAERGLFDETYNGQTFDYNKHIVNPKRKELYDNYGKELSEINKTHYKFEVTPPRPSGVPQGAMYNPKLKKWGWYDQNKKWVTN